ncbi:hypothetical protein NEIFLAOT_00404 [Neisseria flavescens NRL30031/H210]|uniref:Uncharacterized protein n=1 Tax=Neisseria flavescens NRL30031/H210 TaxID=546264 RepID=C0EKG0_NEIFL|nr:hypothetical protein NEIFLAOT_00404 [Neisseria flavescens NRL30031/H210]
MIGPSEDGFCLLCDKQYNTACGLFCYGLDFFCKLTIDSIVFTV